MRALVTGAAGFIGSHLCDRLLGDGHDVIGVDCFRDNYPRDVKEQNLAAARSYRRFVFLDLDLIEDDLSGALDRVDVVFHLASRPGLGPPNQVEFDRFAADNMTATQRLLQAAVSAAVGRFLYASSSSVYGEAEMLPTRESAIPRPLSSYGLTKLAGEHLTHLYARNFGLPFAILRYFTIYGPRQRPDMAIARFIRALAMDGRVQIAGDGEQTRDFTYVGDAVEATVRAATASLDGDVLNIGGGSRCTINAVLATLEEISGTAVSRAYLSGPAADQRHAAASINLARRRLGWEPRVALRSGLAMQWSWFRERGGLGREEKVAVAV